MAGSIEMMVLRLSSQMAASSGIRTGKPTVKTVRPSKGLMARKNGIETDCDITIMVLLLYVPMAA